MKIFLPAVLLLFVSCSSKKQNIAAEIEKNNKEYVILNTDHLKLTGDTNGKYNINSVSYKFEPFIGFDDFKTESAYTGSPAPVRFESNKTAQRFKSRITEIYREQGLNFAGQYCFVSWGCGSPCKASALVDLKTGNVFDGPSSALGYEFRKDSRMIIINPPDSAGFYDDCAYCHPEIWIWNEDKKTFVQKSANSTPLNQY